MGKTSFKSVGLFSLALLALSSITGLFFWWSGPDNLIPAAQPTAAAWSYANFYESQAGRDYNTPADLTTRSAATPPANTRSNSTPTARTRIEDAPVPATAAPVITSDWDKAQAISNEYARMLAANEIAGPNIIEKQPTKAPPNITYNLQVGSGQYNPIGAPTISLAAFTYFLKEKNSPAYPEAVAMYENCLKLSCDPAVALAFFNHESSMGTQGAAVANKSFGNIRCTPGWPCDYSGGGGGFKIYPNWTAGIIDWAILLREVYANKFKLYTLDQIIPVYAPAADNNSPVNYIFTVKTLVDKYRAYKP
ncbi:MAG: hypothetical protein JWP00_2791 [Chloroflexi bacterium]|nr:hypothetical protein [Chloroflexota bacterium]